MIYVCRPVATGGILGQCSPQISFLPPQIFLFPDNFVVKKRNKNKNRAPRKMNFAPPNLKTWIRACMYGYFEINQI